MLQYIGPVLVSSGYACAARNNIAALIKSANVDLTVLPVAFENKRSSFGSIGKLIESYSNRKIKYKINLIHLTPENWPKFIQKDKYNIGYTVWETDKLPKSWVGLINQVQEVWVPSQWNKEVFISSGVTIPIRVVPHTLDITIKDKEYDTSFIKNDEFKFYSIFQWTERKNPLGLLTAYLTEFTANDNVTLILKTYHMNWELNQQQIIKDHVKNLKEKLKLSTYPKINFIGNLLSNNDIYAIHQVGDCLVLPHRGEGFGIPLAEGMLFGNPVITTGWGGNMEFTKPNNSYLIKHTMINVANMPWDKYSPDQQWAEPSIPDLRRLMRHVYDHKEEAKEVALVGQNEIMTNLNYDTIGNLMKELLNNVK